MLYDKAKIDISSGAGGNGCMSFRREAHVPKGGPDGGDGGRGGDVVVLCDDSLRDLQGFRRRSNFMAQRGGHGQGALRHGADGEMLIVRVPPGTQIKCWDGREYDLTVEGQRVTVARGGSGGKGNKRFTSSVRQAPRFAERGLPGAEGWLELQLKLLADVGLVGLPNAGKSSLLARLTCAQPKIANYPFTTLEPVLGVLDTGSRQLIIADIPGLIEGASAGAGLGHDFLAHVERTRVLVHVLDLAPADESDGVERFETIENELATYEPRLAELPRILVLSKSDLVPVDVADAATVSWKERLGSEVPVIVTSSVSHQGVNDLAVELGRRVPLVAKPEGEGFSDPEALAKYQIFRPGSERAFVVDRVSENGFRISGSGVDRLIKRHDLDNDEALAYIEERLKRYGVIDALEQAGFEPGNDVEIAGVVFDLNPTD
jgi:GTPase